MVTVDSETLFNGAAAVVSTIAVGFFVFNVELGYSPVSKALLVGAFLAGVFALTQRTDDYQLVVLGYGVVVTSTLALFFDLVNVFDLGNLGTVVGLLAIAGALFALRGRLDEDSRFVSPDRARTLFAAVAVLAVLVLTVDVVTGGLVYALEPAGEVTYSGPDREGARAGALVVSNPTPLPERVDRPNYRACTAGNWSAYRLPTEEGERQREVEAHLNVEHTYGEHVFGFGEKRYPVTIYLNAVELDGASFPVRQTDECPDDETGEPYLAIYEAPQDRRWATPDLAL